MKRLGLFALLLCISSYAHAGFIYNGNTYELVSSGDDGSWANAQANAEALGGNLVTINDAAEEDWLRAIFGMTERFWIGFTDQDLEEGAHGAQGAFGEHVQPETAPMAQREDG